ncbi:hypothetical protein CDL12_08559 [Handroanthus impetiginosus]|uniref:Arabinogalactan peptide n=1 Tax=Handroanthus impetiginosus TaxID=429701 RepID=A0A2G9HMV7_9LAMI|nr:hypothetical protein CDL12_08559 [Handroanthus impetiginosus]
MDMRKIAYATLIVATSMSVVAATTDAPAPAPSNDATAALPFMGSFVGASILSFFFVCMN